MDINILLEYQKIDLDLIKLEKELRESDAAKEFAFFKSKRSDCLDNINKLEKETDDLFKQFSKLEQSFIEQKKLVSNMQSYLKDIENIDDINEIDFYLKNISRYFETINNIDREIARIRDRLSEVKNNYANENLQVGQCNNRLKKAMEGFDIKKNEITQKATPIQKQLNSIKIEPEALAAYYKKLRDIKRIPMVVEYTEPNCSACGMEIKREVEGKLLKSGDIAECPNCGRLVYRK